MIAPSTQLYDLRPDLTGLMPEFDLQMNQEKMIATKVFAPLRTGLQSGPFHKITLASLMKSVSTKRASGGGYNQTDFEFAKDSYATEEHGVEVPVDERQAAIYGNIFKMEEIAAALSRQKTAITLELRVAAKVFDSGTFTPTAVTTEWSNATSGKPITDVEAAVQRLYAKGIVPNALVINWIVFRNLRNNEQIIDRINSAGAGSATKASDVTAAMLATVFDLPNIIVGGAQHNSAKEGQTASLSPIWSSEYAAVCRVAAAEAPVVEPCIGRVVHWDEDGGTIGGTFESYDSKERRGRMIRNRMETDEKVVHAEAIDLLSNITA